MSGMMRFEKAPLGQGALNEVQQIMSIAYERVLACCEQFGRGGRRVTADAIAPHVLLKPLTLNHRAREWSVAAIPGNSSRIGIECAVKFDGSVGLLALLSNCRDESLTVGISDSRIVIRAQGPCQDYQIMVDAIDFKIYRIRKEMDRQSLDVSAVNRFIAAPSSSPLSTIMVTHRRGFTADSADNANHPESGPVKLLAQGSAA